ncbi:MAG: T9SS type A sorting domain-containing protein [Saprospiraceae bacterium]
MFKIFYSLLLFVHLTALSAQPSIQWQKTLGGSLNENARSIEQTSDGGYITAGFTVSDDGDIAENYGFFDFWVVNFDSLGAVLWKKNYGGSSFEEAFAIKQTSDSGFIVTGYTESNDIDVSGNHGNKDVWLLKLDSIGNIQWQKCLGGSNWDEANDIQLTIDGGFVLVGRSGSTDGDVTGNHGSWDYWVVKLSSTGQIEWQKCYGGGNYDFGYTIFPTSDGGYIVAGEAASTDGDIIGNPGGMAAWVIKLNFEGKIEWQKALGGSYIDRANDIIQTREGGYMVFGQTESNDGDVSGNHGSMDLWAVKLSELGEIEWQRAMGGNSQDGGTSIQQANDGGYIATGIVNSNNGDVSGNHGSSDMWVVKLTEGGEIQWQKALGGTSAERGYSIKQTNDNGYIVAGDAWSTNGDLTENKGKTDLWIVKLAPESTPISTPATQPLNIYPNPASQAITLQVSSQDLSLALGITDFLGRLISQQTISNGGNVDIASLANGLYFLTATTPSGKVFSGKFRKQE